MRPATFFRVFRPKQEIPVVKATHTRCILLWAISDIDFCGAFVIMITLVTITVPRVCHREGKQQYVNRKQYEYIIEHKLPPYVNLFLHASFFPFYVSEFLSSFHPQDSGEESPRPFLYDYSLLKKDCRSEQITPAESGLFLCRSTSGLLLGVQIEHNAHNDDN